MTLTFTKNKFNIINTNAYSDDLTNEENKIYKLIKLCSTNINNKYHITKNQLSSIYIHGKSGIGKTTIIENIAKKTNIELVRIQTFKLTKKILENEFSSKKMSNIDVYSALTSSSKEKKIKLLLFDNIDELLSISKTTLIYIIHMLRPKRIKTKKKEITINCPMILIGNITNIKILNELKKNTFFIDMNNYINTSMRENNRTNNFYNQHIDKLNTVNSNALKYNNINISFVNIRKITFELFTSLDKKTEYIEMYTMDILFSNIIENLRLIINLLNKFVTKQFLVLNSKDLLAEYISIILKINNLNYVYTKNKLNDDIIYTLLKDYINDFIYKLLFQSKILCSSFMKLLRETLKIEDILFTNLLTKKSTNLNSKYFLIYLNDLLCQYSIGKLPLITDDDITDITDMTDKNYKIKNECIKRETNERKYDIDTIYKLITKQDILRFNKLFELET